MPKLKQSLKQLPTPKYSDESKYGLIRRLGGNWDEHANTRAWISPTGEGHSLSGSGHSHESWMGIKKKIVCPYHKNRLLSVGLSYSCPDCIKLATEKGWVRKINPRIYVTDGSRSSRNLVFKHIKTYHPELRYVNPGSSKSRVYIKSPEGEEEIHQFESVSNIVDKLLNNEINFDEAVRLPKTWKYSSEPQLKDFGEPPEWPVMKEHQRKHMYHVTDIKNAHEILKNGLLPAKLNNKDLEPSVFSMPNARGRHGIGTTFFYDNLASARRATRSFLTDQPNPNRAIIKIHKDAINPSLARRDVLNDFDFGGYHHGRKSSNWWGGRGTKRLGAWVYWGKIHPKHLSLVS
jgi:hypothetical protein